MSKHQKYIRRCIKLAQNALGNTYPNPMVGSVVVYNDTIIGEGWHQKAGEAHAEVNAIASVKDKSLLKKSTIYVSLEPCSHFGKTPPCADLIVAHKIPNVVIGCLDPNEVVAGRGVKKLLEAGCKVKIGVLEEASKNINKRFFTFHQKKRPYIILKWAETNDGFIAPHEQETGKPFWITGEASKQLVHKWRSEEQAILVGTNTVVKDNPRLTTRLWEGNNPLRIVIDRHLKIKPDAAIFDGISETIVITSHQHQNLPNLPNVTFETVAFDNKLPEKICEVLYKQKVQSVIIEGGAITLNAFMEACLWDEARVFTGKENLKNGIKAPALKMEVSENMQVGDDTLNIYFNA